jgi:uncharacterized protein (DUF1800 family)
MLGQAGVFLMGIAQKKAGNSRGSLFLKEMLSHPSGSRFLALEVATV